MDVYLVRHGQTDGNLAFRHQHPLTKINELGVVQAHKVAEFLATLKATNLITSTNIRALQTAEIISESVNLIPETFLPFEELHQPQFLVGDRLLSPVAISYMVKWFFGIKSASMHDGEPYPAFVGRLALARKHLEELPDNARVIVVSHSVFIGFFLAHMRHPNQLSWWRAGLLFFKILTIKNSSVTHVRYEKPKNPKKIGWHLIRFH